MRIFPATDSREIPWSIDGSGGCDEITHPVYTHHAASQLTTMSVVR